MILIYSQHYCTRCRKYFNADMTDLAAPGSHYTKRVVDTAVRLVIEDGSTVSHRQLEQGLRITIAKLGYIGSFVSRANPDFCRTVLRLSDSVVTKTAHLVVSQKN